MRLAGGGEKDVRGDSTFYKNVSRRIKKESCPSKSTKASTTLLNNIVIGEVSPAGQHEIELIPPPMISVASRYSDGEEDSRTTRTSIGATNTAASTSSSSMPSIASTTNKNSSSSATKRAVKKLTAEQIETREKAVKTLPLSDECVHNLKHVDSCTDALLGTKKTRNKKEFESLVKKQKAAWKKHLTNAKAADDLHRQIDDDDNNTTEDPDSWTMAELKAKISLKGPKFKTSQLKKNELVGKWREKYADMPNADYDWNRHHAQRLKVLEKDKAFFKKSSEDKEVIVLGTELAELPPEDLIPLIARHLSGMDESNREIVINGTMDRINYTRTRNALSIPVPAEPELDGDDLSSDSDLESVVHLGDAARNLRRQVSLGDASDDEYSDDESRCSTKEGWNSDEAPTVRNLPRRLSLGLGINSSDASDDEYSDD